MTSQAVPVSEDFLRKQFEDERILERAAAGQLRENIKADRAAPDSPDWPAGTRSQIVAYVDELGTVVSEAHRYLRPDQSIAASGMPDPKFLRTGSGKRYYVVA